MGHQTVQRNTSNTQCASEFTFYYSEKIIQGRVPNYKYTINHKLKRARLVQLVRSLTANQEVPGSVLAWSRVELWVTFFRHTIRRQGR